MEYIKLKNLHQPTPHMFKTVEQLKYSKRRYSNANSFTKSERDSIKEDFMTGYNLGWKKKKTGDTFKIESGRAHRKFKNPHIWEFHETALEKQEKDDKHERMSMPVYKKPKNRPNSVYKSAFKKSVNNFNEMIKKKVKDHSSKPKKRQMGSFYNTHKA